MWRVNNAPTVGFEMSAGRRTSVRVVNHVPVEKWLLRDHNRSALLATRDGRENDRYLCAPDEGIEHGCVLSRVAGGAANGRLQQEPRDYRAAHPTHQLTLMNRRMHEYGARCNREIGGNTPSAGLLTVLLALSVCDTPVSLFGFWPFCCHARWLARDELVLQGNRTRFICCSARPRADGGRVRFLRRTADARSRARPLVATQPRHTSPGFATAVLDRPRSRRVHSTVMSSR